MAFRSNAEQLNIEINLLTERAHQGIVNMSKDTRDYATLVEQAQAGIQSMMDKTGMSANAAIAKIKELNASINEIRNQARNEGLSVAGLPTGMNSTLLTSALRDAENIRKGGLSTISAEIQAENKLFDIEQKRTLQAEKQVDVMVEKVLQSRAEAQVDESDLAFERLKTAELERQLQLQTGMNAQQRAITAGRIPLSNIDMRKAISENVMFDVNKFVGGNGLTPQLNAVTTAMNNIKRANPSVTFDEIGNAMKKAGVSADIVAKGVNQLAPAAQRAGQGFSILRSAMGFLTAMALSAIAQGIMSMFKKIIDSASQAEQAFIKLAVAEKSISQAGVDITPKELTDIIDKVAKAYETVSKIDAQKMVSSLAILTKDLKLTAEQYEKVAMSIPLAAMQSNGKTIEQVTQEIINGLTKSGKGWADFGITVDAEIIKQKAVSAGIVKTREAYEALTAEQKQQVEVLALIQILEDNTINNKEAMAKYNNTLVGSQTALNAAWEDFAKSLGTITAPTIIQFLQSLTRTLTTLNEWIEKNDKSTLEFSAHLAGLAAVARVLANFPTIPALVGAFAGGSLTFDGLTAMYKGAYDQAKKYQEDLKNLTNEPTAPKIGGNDSESNQNLLDAEKEFNQAILDAQLKLGQDLEDAAIDYERKLYDISVEYKAKRLDLENDYSKKVADINRSYNEKISEINQRQQEEKQKQRNDELQKEREFQNRMLELKENFLMALDDALHNRDARQILKLIKNYELDKAQAERKNALDKQSAKESAELRQKSFAEDRKKAEADRNAKLAEARRDYADKIAKLNADEAAEREAARLANERKIEDLNREMQDRYEIIAANLVREYNLTEDNLKNIVALYRRYYGDATQILAAMRAQLAGTMQMMAQAGSMGMQYSAPIGPVYGGGNLPSFSNLTKPKPSGGSGKPGNQMAQGGTIIANRPTTVTFGEAGLEAGTFMPLGRVGKDVNSLFSNVGGMGGDGSGKVSIELLLSPDLESRIVSNTLNKTAEVFTRQQRTKR